MNSFVLACLTQGGFLLPVFLAGVAEATNATVDWSLRLAGGWSSKEGRVEVFHTGVWGTICNSSWSREESLVVCRQLGYTGAELGSGVYEYGTGTGPMILTTVQCDGVEANLSACQHTWQVDEQCPSAEVAGVKCSTPAKQGQPVSMKRRGGRSRVSRHRTYSGGTGGGGGRIVLAHWQIVLIVLGVIGLVLLIICCKIYLKQEAERQAEGEYTNQNGDNVELKNIDSSTATPL